MQRWTKIALTGTLVALFVCAPDALAQRKGGKRGGGGGRNPFGSNGLFGNKNRKGARTTPTKPAPNPRAAPEPFPTNSPGRAPLAAEERRFRDLLDQIDKTIAEADRTRAESQHRVDQLGFALPEGVEPGTVEWRNLQKPIFETADYDRSGWISFREANLSLAIDRAEYELYDRDRDGRIGPREFMARYDEVLAQAGGFRLPKPRDEVRRIEPRTPEQLRGAFDVDGDGAIGREELGRLLDDYGKSEVAPDQLLEMLDLDRSGDLGGAELFQLTRLVSVTLVSPRGDDLKRGGPKSVSDLFGAIVPRPGQPGTVAGPPWIPGPVPHFRRLDLDGNGFVSMDELRDLQGAATLGTRVGAVLATLDSDEDGRISEREFLTSLATARK
jgi:Ca2+-binding EF-hand superfamily protein